MPTSAERRDAIAREVADLERTCVEGDRALSTRDWNGFASALRDARRIRHALVNALGMPDPDPDPGAEDRLKLRIRRVFDRRELQLEYLRTYHADVAQRLNVLARWKVAARASAVKRDVRRGAAFESLQ